jgi:hypothetical protein
MVVLLIAAIPPTRRVVVPRRSRTWPADRRDQERVGVASYRMRGVAIVSYVRAWALAASLLVCACGSASTDAPPWTIDDLAPEDGFQLKLPGFEVPMGHEEQSCYFVRVPDLANGQDLWIDRVLIATSVGSHHLNVFRVRTIVDLDPAAGAPVKIGPYDGTVVHGHDDYMTNPCWGSANWADWPLVSNTQSPLKEGPYTDWHLPEHVAIRFSPGEMLMIQPHYVNGSAQATPSDARVGINFYRATEPEPMELGTLFATQQSIRICQSQPSPTFTGTCRFPGAATITAANGHFHSRGRELSIYTWDGMTTTQPPEADQFYLSRSWNNPPMAMGLERPVDAGGGIWWNCSYKWTAPAGGCDAVNAKDPEQESDCCYTFGGNTDVGEHCNVFVYYYPKTTSDLFCN